MLSSQPGLTPASSTGFPLAASSSATYLLSRTCSCGSHHTLPAGSRRIAPFQPESCQNRRTETWVAIRFLAMSVVGRWIAEHDLIRCPQSATGAWGAARLPGADHSPKWSTGRAGSTSTRKKKMRARRPLHALVQRMSPSAPLRRRDAGGGGSVRHASRRVRRFERARAPPGLTLRRSWPSSLSGTQTGRSSVLADPSPLGTDSAANSPSPITAASGRAPSRSLGSLADGAGVDRPPSNTTLRARSVTASRLLS